MEISEFNSAYTRDVIDLIVSIQRIEFDIPITEDQQPDLQDISGYYQKGKGNFWVAIHRGKVVGTISLLDIGGDIVALRKMFVSQEYRGKNYGTAASLLTHAVNWALSSGIKSIYLGTTAQFLAAHKFYEKNGFTTIAKNTLPNTFPVMEVDSRFYRYAF